MAGKPSIIGLITTVLGVILTVAGAPEIGVPLIISGSLSTIASVAFPPPDSAWQSSSTYGWAQFQNAAYDGMPMVTVYGKHKIAPPIVSVRTEQTGLEQTVSVLLCLGDTGLYGYEAVENIRLNEEPIDSYPGIDVQAKLAATQTIKGLDKVASAYLVDTELVEKEWVEYTMRGEADEVALVLQWSSGLFRIASSGSRGSVDFRMRLQIREVGDTEWTEIKGPNASDPTKAGFGRSWTDTSTTVSNKETRTFMAENAANGWFLATDGGWQLTDERAGPAQQLVRFATPARGSYEIRLMLAEGDDDKHYRTPTIIRVEEVRWETPDYGMTGLLYLTAVASAQISGALPRITCDVSGRRVYVPPDGAASWTRNPVWCLRDFLLDPDLCGDWIVSADLDDGVGGTWRTAATECETVINRSTGDVRHELDLVVDTFASAADWLKQILSCFRGALFEATDPSTLATSLRLVRDAARSSVRTFDARETRDASATSPILAEEDGRSTIRVEEIPSPQRPNIVRAIYYDRDNGYVRRYTREMKDQTRLDAGDPEVRQEVHLVGVTREYEALQQVYYVLNRARLTPHVYIFRVGFHDLDLLPGDVVTVYADSPSWSTGKAMMVESIAFEALDADTGGARLTCREYDASAYPSNLGGLYLPPIKKSAFTSPALSYAASGASNVKAEVVYGSRHLRVTWEAKPDTNRRLWRVYYGTSRSSKGRMVAEVDGAQRAYVIRDVEETLHVIRVLAVSTRSVEEDWQRSGGIVEKRVGNWDVAPSSVTSANVLRVDSSMSVSFTADLSPATDPDVEIEVLKTPSGVDAAWGQVIAKQPQQRSGRSHVAKVPIPAVPVPPGPVAPNTVALALRPLNAGGKPGPHQRFVPPVLGGWANRVYTLVASVVGAVSTGFPVPSSVDGWEVTANGIGLRALPPSSDWLGGWGTLSSTGLAPDQPSGARYVTAATITCTTFDLATTMDFAIECYDEAHRVPASNPMDVIESRRLEAFSDPLDVESLDADADATPDWLFRETLSDGTPAYGLRPTRWQVAYGGSSELGTWHEWSPGMLARGRYVRARMLLEDPLGLQQIVAPTVAVGVWTAHADEDHPQVAYSASAFTLGEITDVAGAQTGVVIGIEAIAGSTYYIKVNIGGALYRAALEAVP